MKSIINGNAICIGNVEAPAYIIKRHKVNIQPQKTNNIELEISKIQNAYTNIKNNINSLYERMSIIWNDNAKEIFGAFAMLMADNAFTNNPISLVKENSYTCEYAVYKAVGELMNTFRKIDNSYIRERINDLDEVGYLLINEICGFHIDCNFAVKNKPCIIVSNKVGCVDLALLGKENIKGIITQSNMECTHAILIAQTENIPIVIGAENILELIKDDNIVQINNSQIIVS